MSVGTPWYRELAARSAADHAEAQRRRLQCGRCSGAGVLDSGHYCPLCNGSGTKTKYFDPNPAPLYPNLEYEQAVWAVLLWLRPE